MLREAYMASMWLAYGYTNSSPENLDSLRQTAEEQVLDWVSGQRGLYEPAPRVACSKVLDQDRVEVEVALPPSAKQYPLVERIARFLFVLSQHRIEPLAPAAP